MRDKSFFERIFIMLIAMEFVLLAGVLIAQWSVVSKSSMDEITAGSEDKLGVIKGYSEAVLRDIEKTTLYIALDENISVLDTMREKDLGDIDKVFRLYKLVDFLKLQKSVDNRIASIYIYQDELDMVITSDGDICKSSDFSDSEWKKYYNKDSAFVWTGRRTLGKGAEADAVITLVYPFKNINSSTNYAAVANVSLSALSDSVLTRYKGENHDIVQRAAFLIGSEMLMKTDAYKDRNIGAVTLSEYYGAWNTYLKHYFDMKARYGLTVETGSPTYSKYTVDSMYAIYDFTGDDELRATVGKFLDVYYTDAVLETSGGVRGGAKNRAYQDKYAYTPSMDAINFFQYVQFGTGEEMYAQYSAHPSQLCAAMTDYVAPFVVFDLAYNKTKSGSVCYESQTMAAGEREVFEGTNALNYKMDLPGRVYRKSYVTEGYAMGTQTIDRNYRYTEIHSQNKWMGVTFCGGMRGERYDSRVYVQGLGSAQNGRTGYNEIDGICAEGAMLVAGLPEATNSSGIGIYISQDIFDSKIIEDGWIFGEDADGSCYVAIKPSKGEFQSFEERVGGSLARVSISYVPVVIQVAKRSDYASLDAFAKAVSACGFKWTGNVFMYTTLNGDTIEMSTDKVMPWVNSQEIDTAPEFLVKSPYFNSKYASGVFNITDTKGHEFVVDFN